MPGAVDLARWRINIIRTLFILLAFGLGVAAETVHAAYFNDVGYAVLSAELGTTPPNGTGLTVMLVEAFNTAEPPAWAPNPGSRSITDGDGGPSVVPPYSGHATGSANRFFGDSSTTPGIGVPPSPSVSAYEAGDWILGGFLKTGQTTALPISSSSRIANHSYIASLGVDAGNLELLRRIDWLVDADDFIQVVGFTGNVNNPLLGSAFNVITVNKTGSPTNNGSVPVPGDAAYNVERTRPDLVAPEKNPSGATPRVASAAALLMHTAQLSPSLSNGSTTNRNGDTILNAERPEVIKAALMTGADRATSNTHPAEAPIDIVGYRVNPANQTDNGLDRRYGAGQLNIYNSYHVIAAGEQDSDEDNGSGIIGGFGFDYDPAFGGSNSSNTTGTYYFSTGDEAIEFAASLVWNIEIDSGGNPRFGRPAILRNLDLFLYDVSDSGNWVLLQQSASTIDNTENIRALLSSSTDYALRVKPASGQGNFNWDYAVAWRSHVPGDVNGDSRVDVADLLQMQLALTGEISLDRQQMSRADVYPTGGNGDLALSDLLALQQIVLSP